MTPLVLLVGFLGAGKTTLLRKLVPEIIERGAVPSIILNDYANARVDAALFAEMETTVHPISGSCVCCGSRDELLDTLAAYEPVENGILLLETNGTTDSEELVTWLSSEPRLRKFSLPVQISIVDAKRWQKRFWHNALERAQVGTAAFWMLGHADEAPPARLEEVRQSVIERCLLRHEPTPLAELADLLAAAARESEPGKERETSKPGAQHAAHGHPHTHHHDPALHHFSAVEFQLPASIRRGELLDWLANLPDNVLRAKGVVRFAEEPDPVYLFQKVAQSDTPQIVKLPDASAHPESIAILVGHELHGNLRPPL